MSAPIHVHWEITSLCNLKCLHCYQQSDGSTRQYVGNDILHSIARKLIEGGVFQLTLTGGEPFLVGGLQDLVRYLNDSGITPQISSNGTLIDRAAVSWLRSVRARLQISLDSDEPKVHDYIRRRKGAFELALRGIDLLQEHDIPVSLAFCANRQNFRGTEGVVSLAISKGIEVLAIGEVVPLYGHCHDELAFTPVQYEQFVDIVVGLRQTYGDCIDIQFISEWGFLYSNAVEHSPCTAMDRDMAVFYDGRVLPCPFIRHESYTIGNLLDSDVEQLWHSEAAARFRAQKHLGCDSTCQHFPTCKGGCKASLANRGMPITHTSPSCPLLSNSKP